MRNMPGRLTILIWIATCWIAAACGEVAEVERAERSVEEITHEHVRQYLVEHPELVLEDPEIAAAIDRARSKREQDIAASWRKSVLEDRSDLLNSPLTPSSGKPDAAVTIVEFYDYHCPPCIASHPDVEQVRTTETNLRFVFGQLPIFGSHSIMAARAAIAANRQGLFEPFHAALMTANARLDMDAIFATAAAVGLDAERLRADMRDPEILQYLDEIRQLAEELGVTGTPAFMVGDEVLFGGATAEDLTAALDRQHLQQHPQQHGSSGPFGPR